MWSIWYKSGDLKTCAYVLYPYWVSYFVSIYPFWSFLPAKHWGHSACVLSRRFHTFQFFKSHLWSFVWLSYKHWTDHLLSILFDYLSSVIHNLFNKCFCFPVIEMECPNRVWLKDLIPIIPSFCIYPLSDLFGFLSVRSITTFVDCYSSSFKSINCDVPHCFLLLYQLFYNKVFYITSWPIQSYTDNSTRYSVHLKDIFPISKWLLKRWITWSIIFLRSVSFW